MIQNLSTFRRNAVLGVLALLFVWFVWSIRAVVNPLLLGYLAAFILHPMVSKLEGRGMSRRRAVNTVFVAWFLGAVIVIGGLFTQSNSLVSGVILNRPSIESIEAKIEKSSEYLEGKFGMELPAIRVQDFIDVAKDKLDAMMGGGILGEATLVELDTPPKQGSGKITEAATEAGIKAASGLGKAVIGFFAALLGIGGLLLLVPLYAYYLLFHLGTMHSSVKRYLPKREREKIANVGRQIGAMLAAFFRGRLLVCLLKGAILTVGLLVLRVDYAFLFGMTGGLLSLVPVIGPLAGFLFAAIFTMADPNLGVLSSLIKTGIVFGIGEMIEGYILMPKVIGDSLRMNEVEVLFYLLAGHAAFGMFGILVALPVAAAIKIILAEIVLPPLRDFSDEIDSSGKESGG